MQKAPLFLLAATLSTGCFEHEMPTPPDGHSNATIQMEDWDISSRDWENHRNEMGERLCGLLGHGIFNVQRPESQGVGGETLFCFYPQGFNADRGAVNIFQATRFTTENLEPLYEASQSRKVLLLGEDHGQSQDGDLILKMLPQLKAQGFITIYLEINIGDQAGIDRFFENGDREGLEKIQTKYFPVGSGEEAVRIIEKAKECGLEVRTFSEMENETSQSQLSEQWNRREKQLYENITTSLGEEERIIIVAGRAHVDINVIQENQNGGEGWASLRPPLAHRLIDHFGREQVLTVDLTGNDENYVDFSLSK